LLEEKKDSSRKRVSAFSKVNFTKLKNEEKDERLQNLSKLVKKLRKKVKNLDGKLKTNTNKLLTKYISSSIGISKKKNSNDSLEMDVDKLCKALNNLREYEGFEYEDEKHVVENMINLLAEGKLPMNSINFRKICTQLRLFIKDTNYVNKSGQKITFSFPERDLNITSKEYDYYSEYKDREEVIRMILGIKEDESKNQPEKPNNNDNNTVIKSNCNNEQYNNNNIMSSFTNEGNQYQMNNNVNMKNFIPFNSNNIGNDVNYSNSNNNINPNLQDIIKNLMERTNNQV